MAKCRLDLSPHVPGPGLQNPLMEIWKTLHPTRGPQRSPAQTM